MKKQFNGEDELKCKLQNYKTYIKQIEENRWDRGLGKEFLDLPPTVQSAEEKIHKFD